MTDSPTAGTEEGTGDADGLRFGTRHTPGFPWRHTWSLGQRWMGHGLPAFCIEMHFHSLRICGWGPGAHDSWPLVVKNQASGKQGTLA